MPATMARGDECKTASKANNACNKFEISAPNKKAVTAPASYQPAKKQEPKSYGAWGPVFKDKKNFTDMHLC